ncbi:CAP-associated domain-containing protein [Gracilibacillus halophilus]|uniref:CAP-associated domain-containing protein n=1 Tax=Gracilibacillus halophilus TaxID=470864 RepID=UPI0003A8912A|nr:CAP-associated domain-containing protein [Gracilibacillus halophilus]
MKKNVIITVIIFISLVIVIYALLQMENNEALAINLHKGKTDQSSSKSMVHSLHPAVAFQGELWTFIDESTDQLKKAYGEPRRVDRGYYGYEWWIYKSDAGYFQAGVKDDVVVSLYTPDQQIDVSPFSIGQDSADIQNNYLLHDEVQFDQFTFHLSETDKKQRPLIQVDKNIYAQLYMDTISKTLAGIRIMNRETLILLQPYELYYQANCRQSPSEIKTNKEKSMKRWLNKSLI